MKELKRQLVGALLVVLTAAAAGVGSPTFDSLSRVYVFARVAQSLAHLSSGSDLIVNVRFTFFLVQVVAIVWMASIVVL